MSAKIILALFFITISGELQAQIKIQNGHPLFNRLWHNSVKLGEIEKDERDFVFIVEKILPVEADTLKNRNSESELSSGIYHYSILGFHYYSHFFVIDDGNYTFCKNDRLKSVVSFFQSYCGSYDQRKGRYECFDELWSKVKGNIEVMKYNQ